MNVDDLSTARARLERVEADICGNFKKLGVKCRSLSGLERLEPVSYTHLYWVRKATPGTEESKEPPKKQPIKEVLQDKADEKKAQRTVPAQTKHKQQDMEL